VSGARTGEVTKSNSVDEKSQKGVLVGGSVVLEKSSGVLVADETLVYTTVNPNHA
jgi:hypothetical protein